MKLNIKKASFAAFAVLAMASCSEGKYWDEASDPGQVFAFPKPAATVSVAASESFPSSYEVTINRNNNGAEVTVPVEFKSNSDLLTGPSSVTFPAGSNSVVYPISIAPGAKAGLPYTVSLALAQPESALTHVNPDNLKFTLSISKVLVPDWQSAGKALTFSSGLIGNEDPVEVPVEIMANWPDDSEKKVRLVSPYWYMDPEEAEKGWNIEFTVDANYNAKSMASVWQFTGFALPWNDDYPIGYIYLGTPSNFGGKFINEGDIYTVAGVYGLAHNDHAAAANIEAWNYETLQFKWVRE